MSTRKTAELRHRLGDPSKGKPPTTRAQAPDFQVQSGLTAGPPDDLSDEAKALWIVVTESAKWLVESDTPALILLCRCHDKVKSEFTDVATPTPAAVGLVKLYQALLSDFGLTPRSRVTLGLAVAETESKLGAFKADNK